MIMNKVQFGFSEPLNEGDYDYIKYSDYDIK